MKIRKVLCIGLVLLFAGLGLSCSKEGDETKKKESDAGAVLKLTGAGSTFDAPIFTKWLKDYHQLHPNIQIDYQSLGSGAGIRDFINKTVDFGASDAAMTPAEVAQVDVGVQMLPMTAGSIVLSYNLDGVSELKLSRDAYVGIFLGKVKKWNDPLITAANPGVTLPDSPINVIERADASGTSFVFSKHLSAISEEFAKNPGFGTMPNWAVGTKSKGNEGVTAGIRTTPGAIGYIEYGYAIGQGMPMVSLENKEHKFIKPTIQSAQASLAAVQMPEDLVAWLPDPAGEGSYPIVTYSWMLLYKRYDDPKKLSAIKGMLEYCLTEGQKSSEQLGYIPLPAPVVTKVMAAINNIQGK